MKNKALLGGLTATLLVAGACSSTNTANKTTNTTTTTTNTTTSNTANRTTPPPTNTTNSTTSNTTSTTPPSEATGQQDFTLKNMTGATIYGLFVAPHSDEEWSTDTDILGRDTLAHGESVDIRFDPKEKAAMWDLKVTNEAGASLEWNNLNLMEISELTLYYRDGKATAEFK